MSEATLIIRLMQRCIGRELAFCHDPWIIRVEEVVYSQFALYNHGHKVQQYHTVTYLDLVVVGYSMVNFALMCCREYSKAYIISLESHEPAR